MGIILLVVFLGLSQLLPGGGGAPRLSWRRDDREMEVEYAVFEWCRRDNQKDRRAKVV